VSKIKLKYVRSREEAETITKAGMLPAVDVTHFRGQQLSYELLRAGIRQATMQECLEAGYSKKAVLER
jgi:hypothetical protein